MFTLVSIKVEKCWDCDANMSPHMFTVYFLCRLGRPPPISLQMKSSAITSSRREGCRPHKLNDLFLYWKASYLGSIFYPRPGERAKERYSDTRNTRKERDAQPMSGQGKTGRQLTQDRYLISGLATDTLICVTQTPLRHWIGSLLVAWHVFRRRTLPSIRCWKTNVLCSALSSRQLNEHRQSKGNLGII